MVVPLPPPQRHHLDKLEHVHSDQQGFHGHPHLVAPKRTPEMRKTADPAGGDPENEWGVALLSFLADATGVPAAAC